MSNNDNWNRDFGLAGPYTNFHHQCLQMVDLTMMHCERKRNGLNLHALLYEPEESNVQVKEEIESPSEGEKVEEQQQSRANKLMNGYDFGWKIPSMHERMNGRKNR